MYSRRPFLLCLLLLLNSPLGACREVFLSSSSGSDDAAGDKAHPWRSFTRLTNEPLAGGDSVYLAAGDVWNEPLLIARAGIGCLGHMRGVFEALNISPTAAVVHGWVVDPGLPGNGTPPVDIRVVVDGARVLDTVANISRPDLPKAGVAPNADHGFSAVLSADVVKSLQHGIHRIEVYASGSAALCGKYAWQLPDGLPDGKALQCLCDGAPCECGPVPASPPLIIMSTGGPTDKRPTILLNGTGTAATIVGFDAVSVKR
jgi:hypothetical protein